VIVWGGGEDPAFWQRFRAGWREALEGAVAHQAAAGAAGDAPLEDLRRTHRAQARAEPGGVHPTWWVRALKDESPAVRRVVSARAGPELQPILQHGLGLGPAELESKRPTHPDALRWVLGLWDERVVGDLREGPDEPRVVIALSRLTLRELVTLAEAAGLAKLALAGDAPARLRSRLRYLFVAFQRGWGQASPTLRSWARNDYLHFMEGRTRKQDQPWCRLGLITLGRLLAGVEPYRARWALQHLPYAIARMIRPAIKDPGTTVAASEAQVLRTAWNRLAVEGRIPLSPQEVAHEH
jgi:hypothetical protein